MFEILLVDDDAAFRAMVKKTLERAGYRVREAADGAIGLKLHRERASDLLLTDLVMPNTEGLELITTLRREAPGMRIIAMSGGGRGAAGDYLAFASLLGAAATLAKPFTQQQLLSAIGRELEGASK